MSDLTKALKNKLVQLCPTGKVSIVADSDGANYNEIIAEFRNGITEVYDNITDAVGNLRSNCGDVVAITSGSYAPSASIAIDKSDVKIMGLSVDGMGADVSITGASDADEIFNVNANKVVFEGLRFNCYSTTKNGIAFGETAVSYYSTIRNCTFNGGATQIVANGLYDLPNLTIDNCRFWGATTSMIDVNASWTIIQNSLLATRGVTCTDMIRVGGTDNAPSRDNVSIIDCILLGINATDGIDVDGGSNCTILGTRVTGATNELTDGGTNTEAIGSYKDSFTDANAATTYIQAAIKP